MKWLAGVRPRSMATTSAIASSPGVRARIAAPSSAGTLPPATGSNAVLMVPPVKMTATRAIGRSVPVGRVGRAGTLGGRIGRQGL